MIKIKKITTYILLFISLITYSQQKPALPKIVITGTIVEAVSKRPLEYATITLKNTTNPKMIFGGITDSKGNFSIEAAAGTFNIILI
jgi:hypothetical protein